MVAFVLSSTEVQSRDEDKLCMCSQVDHDVSIHYAVMTVTLFLACRKIFALCKN